MRHNGIEGKLRDRKRSTTIPNEAAVERAHDLLPSDFAATRPNAKWVADLTPSAPGRFRLPRLHPRLLPPDDR
jgi:transposase InsO family protein